MDIALNTASPSDGASHAPTIHAARHSLGAAFLRSSLLLTDHVRAEMRRVQDSLEPNRDPGKFEE
jgi:hypothetical protein